MLALTVSFTGLGVTIMNYCCNSCQGQTLLIYDEICCLQNHHLKENQNHSCCSSTTGLEKSLADNVIHEDDSCTVHRLSIDLDASSFRPNIQAIYTWVLDSYLIDRLSQFLLKDFAFPDLTSHFKSPPQFLPRIYLSFIRVLII